MHYDYKVQPLHAMLPKSSTYVKSCDGQTKWMYFLIEDDDLLNNIIDLLNIVWNKISASIKKEFDSKSLYNKTIFEKPQKSYVDEATYSHSKEIPRVVSNLFV